MILTPRSALLILLGIIPTALSQSYIVALLWVLLVSILCLIDYLTLKPIKRISVERQVPLNIRNGESFTSKVFISNPTKTTIQAIVRDAWQPSAGSENDRKKIEIQPEKTTILEFLLTPTRRGTKIAHKVTVRAFGKLKLTAVQKHFDAPAKIVILPEFKSRKQLPSKLKQLREIEGAVATHLRGKGTEFDSMRKYVIGDDIRDIDWRASARAQSLIVRSWHPEQDRKILILVDISRLSAIRTDNAPRLDSHIETCLLLSALATHAHDKVEVLVVDSTLQSTIIPKNPQSIISDIAHAFADIFPQLKEITWSTYIPTIKSKMKNNGIIVFITPLDQNAYTNGLLKTALHLNKGHTIIIASSYKDEFENITEESDAYDKAAAASSQLIRNEIKTKFGMNKIHIVETNPEQLPGKVCDKYLQLKAKGIL